MNYPEGRRTPTTLHKTAARGEGNGRRSFKASVRPQGNEIRRRTGTICKGGADPLIKPSHRRHTRRHPAPSHPSAEALSDGMRRRRHHHRHSGGHAHCFVWYPFERTGGGIHSTQRSDSHTAEWNPFSEPRNQRPL